MNQDLLHPEDDKDAAAVHACLNPRRRLGVFGWCSVSLAGLLLVALSALGIFVWTLHNDRNSGFLRQQLLAALSLGLGEGHSLSVATAGLRFAGLTSTFSIGGLAIANPATGAQAALDQAEVEVSTASLWLQTPEARALRLKGLKLVVPAARATEQPLAAHEALALFRAVLAGAHLAGTGKDPIFRTIEHIEGTDISIFQRQSDGQIVPVQSGLVLDVRRLEDGQLTASLGKAGQPKALSLKAHNRVMADGGSMMLLESDTLELQAIGSLLTMELPGLDPKLRIRMSFHSRVGPDGQLIEKGARLDAMDGLVTPPDPDVPPFHLDQASLEMRMRPDSPEILVDRLRLRFEETEIQLSGRLDPQPGDGGGIAVSLRSERADIGRLSPSETPFSLDALELQGQLSANLRSFRIDKFQVREDAGHATMSGMLSAENDGLVETRLAVENLDLRKALRIWPVWVAPPVRRWLIEHAEAGILAQMQVNLRLAGQVLRDSLNHGPIPDDALNITFRLGDTTLRPLKDAAPLLNLNGHGRVSGQRADAVIESAKVEPVPGRNFAVRAARLSIPNTTLQPSILNMTVPIEGQLSAFVSFLAAPSLREVVGLPPDASVADGVVQGQATVVLPLAKAVAVRDVKVDFKADMRQVAIDNIIKNERLDSGTFSVSSRNGALAIQGDARLFGVTNQIEIRQEPGKPGQVVAKAMVDEALLARRGMDLRPAVQGPMQMTVALPLSRLAQTPDIEIDLSRARIETGIPGLSKKAGQPGRVKFTLLTRPEGSVLDNFDLDLNPASLRGRVEIGRDGQFSKADFSTFRLSAGDNARLQADRQRGPTRLVLRGNSFDLRPFLRGYQAGKIEDGRAADRPPDFDLDLQSTVLIGFNGELMSGVETRIARRAGRVTQVVLKGQFGGAPVTASSSEGQRDTTLMNATSQDGGALLRFLDIYGKAHGGRLTAEILIGAQSQQGVVQIRDFTIRGEAALRQVGASGRSISATQNLGEEVTFTKMRADFSRRPGRLDLREAVMWGNQLGGTIEGTLDYAADRVDLKGVFVPAYALNNFFASVPLLGPILGGAQYEGLFAVPFVITGRASAPVMRINPVSAIAPGFLRKIFEIQREGGGNVPALNRAN